MRCGRALVYGAGLLWIAAAVGGTAYLFLYEDAATRSSHEECSIEDEMCPLRGTSHEHAHEGHPHGPGPDDEPG